MAWVGFLPVTSCISLWYFGWVLLLFRWLLFVVAEVFVVVFVVFSDLVEGGK